MCYLQYFAETWGAGKNGCATIYTPYIRLAGDSCMAATQGPEGGISGTFPFSLVTGRAVP
jgi:hypothetical protein